MPSCRSPAACRKNQRTEHLAGAWGRTGPSPRLDGTPRGVGPGGGGGHRGGAPARQPQPGAATLWGPEKRGAAAAAHARRARHRRSVGPPPRHAPPLPLRNIFPHPFFSWAAARLIAARLIAAAAKWRGRSSREWQKGAQAHKQTTASSPGAPAGEQVAAPLRPQPRCSPTPPLTITHIGKRRDWRRAVGAPPFRRPGGGPPAHPRSPHCRPRPPLPPAAGGG